MLIEEKRSFTPGNLVKKIKYLISRSNEVDVIDDKAGESVALLWLCHSGFFYGNLTLNIIELLINSNKININCWLGENESNALFVLFSDLKFNDTVV